MIDPDAGRQPRTSAAPIWIALVLGILVALPWWPYGLLATLPLALLVGIVILVTNRSNATWHALRARNEGLAARIGELERDLAALKLEVRVAAQSGDQSPPAPAAAGAPPASSVMVEPAQPVQRPTPVEPVVAQPEPAAAVPLTAAQLKSAPQQAKVEQPAAPSALQLGLIAARNWLLGGNTVARVGVLVLFVGIAFLLRYVAEHTRVPIEVRLLGVALGALVFLALGWRLRVRRPGFAITLQGAAIGILYLTTFAALRLYAVLPPLVAFAFMALLAVLAGLLAILQDARALAALGAAGGFLAPILISTGEGRVALLFSYYLLLNCGVLGIAWFRAWRELNWIGFVATFGVSALWAVHRYTPADFLVGQTFLIVFWLLFLAVSLLYALRQTDRKRGMFDTTLVFTLPLAAFGIQTRFTHGLELALASAVAAATYLVVSMWLLRRREAAFQLLTEACFALGVGFLTLAIPLAASAQWTAAAWAVEGLALLWVGLRQNRVLPLAAGGLLHVLGAVALVRALGRGDVSIAAEWSGLTVNLGVFALTAFVSSHLLARGQAPTAALQEAFVKCLWLARAVGWAWVALLVWQPLAFPWYVFAWCALAVALIAFERREMVAPVLTPEWVAGVVLIALAAFAAEERFPHDGAQTLRLVLRLAVSAAAVSAALLSLRAGDRARRTAAAVLLTLGVLAWLVAVLAEAVARVDAQLAVAQLALALIGVTSVALAGLGARLRWEWPQRLAWVFFAAHVVFAGYVVVQAVFAATLPSRHYGWVVWPLAWALFYFRLGADERATVRLPVPIAWHVAGLWLLTVMVAAELALRVDHVAGDGWFHAAWGATLALALWLTAVRSTRWPIRLAPDAYARIGAPGLAVFAALWLLVANVRSGGDPAPLPALPVVNPMDLVSLAVLCALFLWHMNELDPGRKRVVRPAIAVMAFLVLNVVALRAVHFTAGVGWSAVELGRSLIVQAVLSLLWTAAAMTLMLLAHRRRLRPVWIVGAMLLAAVVAKLFVVDLSGQGTIERIVSFVGVGLLILLIGYLAPVPPTVANERATEAS
ncbi:MAG TPA: DUF2339 domain-containing protein [Burkholderiaceae bacterium]|nr:DUF2339 domain-containing protein [Burkholderiaceae bacterium]